MRHYVRGLAAKIIGKWQGHVRKSRTEIVFAELGRLRGLAQRFAQLRLGVEISKDERVQARHSDVYRRIFLLSRSHFRHGSVLCTLCDVAIGLTV